MLSFCTEFPVDSKTTLDDFLGEIQDWVLCSPHTLLQPDDLKDFSSNDSFYAENANQRLRGQRVCSGSEEAVSFQNTVVDGDLEWSTLIVFSKHPTDCWVSVRTSVESAHPIVRLPPAKKPRIVRNLLDNIGGAKDGLLRVSSEPHLLTNNDIVTASKLIMGTAGCWLPVVYISCGFHGEHPIDANALASDLSGMAHVVVEPNRPFSRRLQIEVKSANSYGGSIGVYWPNATGRRSFFVGSLFEDSSDLKRAIVDEVRAALLNRRPMYRATLAAVDEVASRTKLEALKASGSQGLDEYIANFDRELKAKDDRLVDSEKEISRLQSEIRKYEADTSVGRTLSIGLGDEQDLYAGEIAGFVLDALVDSNQRVQVDSRRAHVISSLLSANTKDEKAAGLRDELKEILRDYSSMTKAKKAAIEGMGFSITEDGKHHKLVFQGDDRYTFALPKSGSDRRGGLNSASDISKRLF